MTKYLAFSASQRMIYSDRCLILVAIVLATWFPISLARGVDQRVKKDLVYRTVGERKLFLDIYYPPTASPIAGYPLIISIHGGAWAYADRHNDLILRKLTDGGYALASIDYRLSGEAKYPAQIDDTREAVQWLVKHAATLRLDPHKMVATGISAGGHLALLLALSQLPGNRSIKAVCALYGPSDLIAMLPPEQRDKSTNPIAALLGAPVSKQLALARAASPITYVSKDSVPVMLFHGEQDKLVPVEQSIALDAALKAAGAQSTLIIYKDKGHAFGLDDEALRKVKEFFDRSLKN
jgi:acetyl esterase/lipase